MMIAIWFFLWALLWAIYFILDGFDLGSGTLMPFLARGDDEKRMVYNASGPFWDGNEVWLITAGGVTFAAFPLAYAVMFSALYAPLLILLFALIFRAVAFEFRSKIDSKLWRFACDCSLFLGSFVPALLLGVAFANLFMGIPIDENGVYHGTLLTLLNPYGLAGGILFVMLFINHGALWLAFKTEGNLQARAHTFAVKIWPYLLSMILIFLAMTASYTELYNNMSRMPIIWALLILAVMSLLAMRFVLSHAQPDALRKNALCAWGYSVALLLTCTLFFVCGMYPGMIISSLDPAYTVTVYNAASSPLTLTIMLWVALCAVPVVIAYQLWVYIVFSHKVTQKELASEHAY